MSVFHCCLVAVIFLILSSSQTGAATDTETTPDVCVEDKHQSPCRSTDTTRLRLQPRSMFAESEGKTR